MHPKTIYPTQVQKSDCDSSLTTIEQMTRVSIQYHDDFRMRYRIRGDGCLPLDRPKFGTDARCDVSLRLECLSHARSWKDVNLVWTARHVVILRCYILCTEYDSRFRLCRRGAYPKLQRASDDQTACDDSRQLQRRPQHRTKWLDNRERTTG